MATDGFLTNNYQKLDFKESSFINVIESFNKSLGGDSKKLIYTLKPIKYISITALGNKLKNESEFFGQILLRVYFPKISRKASFNVGLNISNYNKSENNLSNYYYNEKITGIPILLQYNLLSKIFRPYLMIGVNINNRIIKETYLQEFKYNNLGIVPTLGIGFEIDLFKGFMIKSEIKKDYFKHKTIFGMGYNFSI